MAFTTEMRTPTEAIELASRTGAKKGHQRADTVFLSGISAGCLLSFASASYLIIITDPTTEKEAPGIVKLFGAALFPVGLVLCTITGADLCTASFMYTTLAVLHRRLSLPRMLLHWFLTFWGNLIGSLIVVTLIFGAGGVFDKDPYLSHVSEFIVGKQVTPYFYQIFVRGIGCNWLVSLGIYLSLFARDLTGKIIGMWFPILVFVLTGMDHVVANMFFVPMALWLNNTPGLTVPLYIWKGIIPAGLGNIVGAGVFASFYYWFMYLRPEEEVVVDGDRFDGSHVGLLGGHISHNDLENGHNKKERTPSHSDSGVHGRAD